jgi:hypothetical protein
MGSAGRWPPGCTSLVFAPLPGGLLNGGQAEQGRLPGLLPGIRTDNARGRRRGPTLLLAPSRITPLGRPG